MADTITNPKNGGLSTNIAKPVPLISTTTGTIQKGFRSAGVINSGNAAGTFNGVAVPAGESVTYPYVGLTYEDALSWDASSTTFSILVVY